MGDRINTIGFEGEALSAVPLAVRVGAGGFHEGSGGFYVTGGPAFRFDRVVRFTDRDVVRHPLVARIVRAYEAADRARKPQP